MLGNKPREVEIERTKIQKGENGYAEMTSMFMRSIVE